MEMLAFDMHAVLWLAIGFIVGCAVSGLLVARIRGRKTDEKAEQLQKEVDLWAYRSLSQEAAAQKARTELHANVSATIELKHKLSELEQQHSVMKSSMDRHRALLDYAVSAYTELRHQRPAANSQTEAPNLGATISAEPSTEQERTATP